MAELPNPSPSQTSGNNRALKVSFAIFILVALVLIAVLGMPYLRGGADDVADAPAATGTPSTAASTSPAAPKAKPGDCRPFDKVVDVGGEKKTLTGTACMQPDGSWKIMAD